jgi:hypothetical protein
MNRSCWRILCDIASINELASWLVMEDTNFNLENKQLILFSSSSLQRVLVTFHPNSEAILSIKNEDFFSLTSLEKMFGQGTKAFSKKEQFQILDIIKKWLKPNAKSQSQNESLAQNYKFEDNSNSPFNSSSSEQKFDDSTASLSTDLLISPDLAGADGLDYILDSLRRFYKLEIKEHSFSEVTRQGFLGSKLDMGNFPVNSKIAHIHCSANKTLIALGDFHSLEKVVSVDFGIDQIVETINELRRANHKDSLVLFVKSNLYRFIELTKSFGKPHLVTFDDLSTDLLSRSLTEDLRTHRINAEWIQQLCYKILDSDSQYLNRKNYWVSSEAIDYASARIVLIGFLLEGLGANVCHLDSNLLPKGYSLDNMIQSGYVNSRLHPHHKDWKKSCYELLISMNPQEFSTSLHKANLAERLLRSSKDLLHNWTDNERKVLWISTFLDSSFGNFSTELSVSLLQQLLGVDKQDCELIACAIAISANQNLSVQSKFLDTLEATVRTKARKLSSMIMLARSLDVTGRLAIADVTFKQVENEREQFVLKLTPRLNPAPELIQSNIVKKNLERIFEINLLIEQETIGKFPVNENFAATENELIEF